MTAHGGLARLDAHHHGDGASARAAPLMRALPALGCCAALVAVPVAAGVALDPQHMPEWTCPLLAATGVPCPACGATRAFVFLTHGDASFLHYNWVWILIWAVLLAWVVRAAWRRWRAQPIAGPRLSAIAHRLRHQTLLVVALPFAVLLPAWLVALANLQWIK